MELKRVIALVAVSVLAGSPVLADAGHSAAGEPAETAEAQETITVVARETDDGKMVYEPSTITVAEGATVHLVLDNEGELEHELYLGTPEEIEKHAEQMMKFPEMEHDEPSAVRVDPGHQDAIHWQFTKGGTFTFACLIPGHMELGMVGQVSVVDPARVGMLD